MLAVLPSRYWNFCLNDGIIGLLSSEFMDYARFENYYSEFKHKIYSYLFYRSGRNRELAEDLTAEVFLKALEKIERYDEERSFKTWIYAIAHNHLIDYFRKNKKQVDLEEVEDFLASDMRTEEVLDHRLAAEQVAELLPVLSDKERDIVLLRYHQDLSTRDIAEQYDESEGNVRVLLHRAIGKMNKKAQVLFLSFLLFFLSL
jgi:RNA polymerase sigma-70 factor, ECF subfamily